MSPFALVPFKIGKKMFAINFTVHTVREVCADEVIKVAHVWAWIHTHTHTLIRREDTKTTTIN